MNRKSFIAELRSLLSFMDAEDRQYVLDRYDAMFDEAGEEEEERLITVFGSPVRQVLKIEKEYRDGTLAAERESAAKAEETTVLPVLEINEENTAEILPEELKDADPFPELSGLLMGNPNIDENFCEENTLTCPEDSLMAEDTISPDENCAEELTLENVPAFTAEPVTDSISESEKPEHSSDFSAELSEEDSLREIVENETCLEEPAAQKKNIMGAILISIPMIAFCLLGLALSVALGAVFLAAGAALVWVVYYLAGYITSRGIPYMPDMLLVGGAALVTAAFALLFIWLGLWIAIVGIILTVRITKKVYHNILYGK